MAYKVIYSNNAQEDLHNILDYLVEERDFLVAEKFSDYLISVTDTLARHPYSGRSHKILSSIREFPVKPYYIVFYAVLEDLKIIHVLNIVDSRRQHS
jgi:plasmid stabilization system protein ParE